MNTHAMPKRKADAAPTGIGAPKVGRGGGSRGAGRKSSAVNAKGVDGPAAPRCTQATLGDLLGERLKKNQQAVAVRSGAGAGAAAIRWDYVQHDGGEDGSVIPQEQRPVTSRRCGAQRGLRSRLPTPHTDNRRQLERQDLRLGYSWTTWKLVAFLHDLAAQRATHATSVPHVPHVRPAGTEP